MDHTRRMTGLTAWLEEHRTLWQSRPFVGLPVVWEDAHPGLARALRDLPEAEVDRCEDDPAALAQRLPAPFGAWAAAAERWAVFDRWTAHQALEPATRPRGIKARKWSQIVHFAQAVETVGPPRAGWVEWCSGKGHLGRLLARASDRPVTSVERDGELCAAGEELAHSEGTAQRFVQADVLTDALPGLLGPGRGVAALHACGRLHTRLLRAAVQNRLDLLALAPCCYQRYETRPRPLSELGLSCDLHLGPAQMRLASFDEPVASPASRRQRRLEQAYRLAIDLLLRETRGQDCYHPLGPIPAGWFKASFADFARRLFADRGWDLPRAFPAGRWEARGRERHHLARALGLVRGLFRRPLETWLVLDRIAFLEENGYRTQARTFCVRQVTPRNLLIIARRSC